MKAVFLAAVCTLAGTATAKPCPFAEMKEKGALSQEARAKFDMVRRDPAAAERLLFEHRMNNKRNVDVAAEVAPRQNSSDGLLDILPIGGGLRRSNCFATALSENYSH